MKLLNEQWFRDAAYEADLDFNEITYFDYSGRGMYGKECVGFTCSTPELVKLFTHLAVACEDDSNWVFDLLETVRIDQLGRGLIHYFPDYTFSEEDSDEHAN